MKPESFVKSDVLVGTVIAILPEPNIEVLLMVLIFVPDTNVSCLPEISVTTVRLPEPNRDSLLIVLIFVPDTNVACLPANAVSTWVAV